MKNMEKLDYFDSNVSLLNDVQKYCEIPCNITEDEFLRCYTRSSGFQEINYGILRIGCRTLFFYFKKKSMNIC